MHPVAEFGCVHILMERDLNMNKKNSILRLVKKSPRISNITKSIPLFPTATHTVSSEIISSSSCSGNSV